MGVGLVLLAAFCTALDLNKCTIDARKAHCPPSAVFFGYGGCACALVFACLGAAYGTAKSGVGVANMGVMHPDVDEVDHSSCYGWCAWNLRSHCRCASGIRNQGRRCLQLLLILWLLRALRRTLLWPCRPCCRYCYWHCW